MASETNDANFARIMCAEVAQAVRERAYPGATIETIAATIAARIAAARREGAEADAEADVIHRLSVALGWGPAVKPYRTIAEFVAFEQECRKVREESDTAHTERVVRETVLEFEAWYLGKRPSEVRTDVGKGILARALAAAKGGQDGVA